MKVIVVGGGAAGMMAAIAAAESGHQVELLERNEKLGKKIYITGKGRCNVTNACDLEEFFTNIVSNEKFLYSSIYQYDNQAVMDFFESNGCPLKVERGNRVFPVSDHASDVTKALADKMTALGVKITLHCKVEDLIFNEDGSVGGVVTSRNEKKKAERVIFATGGLSYEPTGSDGSGIRILEKYGHTIAQTKPALVPFELKEDVGARLQGLALKNVNFSIKNGKKKVYDGFGEMLFTHFGISGPTILSGSAHLVR